MISVGNLRFCEDFCFGYYLWDKIFIAHIYHLFYESFYRKLEKQLVIFLFFHKKFFKIIY